MPSKFSVVVVGTGLIGQRRAKVAAEDMSSQLQAVVDVRASLADEVARAYGALAFTDYKKALRELRPDVVVVSTPNHLLEPIALEALGLGCHVLIEKPMGRNLAEAKRIQQAAKKAQKSLKVGFNHRYHPALLQAKNWLGEGRIGKVFNLRAVYGHGGRPGYEREWRVQPQFSGGGELLDQGAHLVDLFQWFCGPAKNVYCATQSAFWTPDVCEDNAFGVLRFSGGECAQFHVSWTQWKNLFVFDIFGALGSISVRGLGGNYGEEKLTLALRKKAGGAPDLQVETFTQPDDSWKNEWRHFLESLRTGQKVWSNATESYAVMRTIAALYDSAKKNKVIRLEKQK